MCLLRKITYGEFSEFVREKKIIYNVFVCVEREKKTIWTFDEKNPHPEKVFPKER